VSLTGDSTVNYGGTYRAVCLEVLTDSLRVQIPQVFGATVVTIFESAGPRPFAGDQGWVFFESGLAEYPVWAGSESIDASSGGGGGSGGGLSIWAPYKVKLIPLFVTSVLTGTYDVELLNITEAAVVDGWIEINVSGGYVLGDTNITGRQGIYIPDYVDPTGQGWLSFGYHASPSPSVWDSIGQCQMSVPMAAGQGREVWWRGNWSPASAVASFRSNAVIKFYSVEAQPVNQGPRGPQGPPGDSVQAVAFRFVQPTAATIWLITHSLPFQPNVQAVDSAGSRIIPGDVTYLSGAVIRLTFSSAVAGEAYLS
jgi:hypothetical protein